MSTRITAEEILQRKEENEKRQNDDFQREMKRELGGKDGFAENFGSMVVLNSRSGPEAKNLPSDEYTARFVDWRPTEIEGKKLFSLTFMVLEGTYKGKRAEMLVTPKLTKSEEDQYTSRLFKTISILQNKEPEPGEMVSLNDVVYSVCRIKTDKTKNGWPKVTEVVSFISYK